MITDPAGMNDPVVPEVTSAWPSAMDGFGPSEWRAAMLSTVGVIENDVSGQAERRKASSTPGPAANG